MTVKIMSSAEKSAVISFQDISIRITHKPTGGTLSRSRGDGRKLRIRVVYETPVRTGY